MIVGDHEISRAACRVLLRAEGVDVVADLGADDHALRAASALHPEVVIVDVTLAADTGFDVARRLRALPAPPIVILTSSFAASMWSAAVMDPALPGRSMLARASPADHQQAESAIHAHRLQRTKCLLWHVKVRPPLGRQNTPNGGSRARAADQPSRPA
jgi:DNA-binding NarL/FixJ family response regulator